MKGFYHLLKKTTTKKKQGSNSGQNCGKYFSRLEQMQRFETQDANELGDRQRSRERFQQ